LWSGVSVVASPDVERRQAIDHGNYTLFVFVLPLVLSAGLEASASLVSHVVPRRKVLRLAQWGLCGALLLCGFGTTPWTLAVGLSLAGAASGVACAAAEASLVARHAGDLDRIMARWMLAGGVGDVLAPSVMALVLLCGGSYRSGFFVVVGWIALQAALQPSSPSDPSGQDGEDSESVSVWGAVVECSSNWRLWLWLSGTALCTLLDELVAALSALRLRTELGASDAQATSALIGYSGGIVLGAMLTERCVRKFGFRRILLLSAALCTLALASLVTATNIAWFSVSLMLVGVAAAAHYPLLLARAYEAAPGREAIVGALAEVFVVFEVLLPWVLGELADRHGLRVTLLCLVAQPLGVVGLLLIMRRTRHGALE
jgi:MFS family permease